MNSQNLNKAVNSNKDMTKSIIPGMVANKAAAMSVLETLRMKYAASPATCH